MKKEIKIGEQSVTINSSAGWFYDYREEFGHDIMPDLMPILESILGAIAEMTESGSEELLITDELVEKIIDALATAEITTIFNITWAMAHNEDEKIDRPKKWANSFESFPIDEVVPELITTILESSVSSKNAKSLLERVKKVNQ